MQVHEPALAIEALVDVALGLRGGAGEALLFAVGAVGGPGVLGAVGLGHHAHGLQVVAVLPVEGAGAAAAHLLDVARQVFEVLAGGELHVVPEIQRRRAAAAGDGDGLLEAGAVGAVDEGGGIGAVDRARQAVFAVVDAGVAAGAGRAAAALAGHAAVGVVEEGLAAERAAGNAGQGVGPHAPRLLRGVGIGADPGVGHHVADEVVGEGLIQAVVAEVVGGEQAIEVVIAVGPAVAGLRAGDGVDAAKAVARVGVVLERARRAGGDERQQPAALGRIGHDRGGAVRAGQVGLVAAGIVEDARRGQEVGHGLEPAGGVVGERADAVAVGIALGERAAAEVVGAGETVGRRRGARDGVGLPDRAALVVEVVVDGGGGVAGRGLVADVEEAGAGDIVGVGGGFLVRQALACLLREHAAEGVV